MSTFLGLNRFQAGLTHLGISSAVALISLAVVFLAWYPGVMAQAQGVSRLLLILIGVDLVLGPVITTIIWNPAKGNWLRFDLAVIATMQTLAFLYGMQAIYGGRPAYLVFNMDRFDLVARQEVDGASLARAMPEHRISFWGPKTVSARLPEDPKENQALLLDSVAGGPDLPQLPHLFLPPGAETPTMLAMLRPLRELRVINELTEAEWSVFLEEWGKSESELGYLPMKANAVDGAVILNAETGAILGIRLLTPNFDKPKVTTTGSAGLMGPE